MHYLLELVCRALLERFGRQQEVPRVLYALKEAPAVPSASLLGQHAGLASTSPIRAQLHAFLAQQACSQAQCDQRLAVCVQQEISNPPQQAESVSHALQANSVAQVITPAPRVEPISAR